jgi:glycosyltransferase involved in cell wall biosynthesis
MTPNHPHICILSFSHIASDARVLRQIEYLSPHYDITVVGYGDAPPEWEELVNWHNVQGDTAQRRRDVNWYRLSAWGGRFLSLLYDAEFRYSYHAQQAKQALLECQADVYHANDWNSLPLVIPVAKQVGAKVVFDAHEFPRLQFDSTRARFIHGNYAHHHLRRYAHQANAMTTVSPLLAQKYAEDYGLDAQVIMSAPRYQDLQPSVVNSERIDIVHHGGAERRRHLELMLEMMRYTDSRFHLHLYLIGNSAYVADLQVMAQDIALDRIHFHEPMSPVEIPRTINKYDIGIFILKPNTFNHMASLPNKFFDFINARLAVCITPTAGMKALAEQHNFSLISETYEPREIAEKLNQLTPEDIMRLKQGANQATQVLNADVEMGKLLAIYEDLLA